MFAFGSHFELMDTLDSNLARQLCCSPLNKKGS